MSIIATYGLIGLGELEGPIDKAIARLEKLRALHPDAELYRDEYGDLEYHFFIEEVE